MQMKKTQGKLVLKPYIYSDRARCPVRIDLPASRLLGWCSTNWAIDPQALVSAKPLSNLCCPDISAAAQEQTLFCLCWRVCFLARAASVLDSRSVLESAACRAVSTGAISTWFNYWDNTNNLPNHHHINPLRITPLRTWGCPSFTIAILSTCSTYAPQGRLENF